MVRLQMLQEFGLRPKSEVPAGYAQMILLGIFLAAVVLVVISSWWSEGYIGGMEAVVLFAVYGGLIFGLFVCQTTAGRAAMLIPLVGSAAWGAYLLKAGSIRSYYKEKVRQYEAAIDEDPRNFAARARLAETLYELGEIERAMAEMQMAIDLSPHPAVAERFTLKRWQDEERLKESRNVLCYRCGHENESGLKVCANCQAELRYPIDAAEALNRNMRQFVAVSAGVALSFVSFVLLPWKYALIPAGCSVLVAVGQTLLGSKPRQPGAIK